MEGILLLISLLLRKGGFSSLSSTVEVACPFYVKECFVLELSFCLSRDIKSIHGASGVFLLWGWGNTFLFVRSLLLIQRRLIWTKSLIIGYYERKQYCPTGRKTAETENVGSSAVRSMEEGRADVVHRNVTSVTFLRYSTANNSILPEFGFVRGSHIQLDSSWTASGPVQIYGLGGCMCTT